MIPEERIELGRVIGVHGLAGEVAVRTTGDSPEGLGRYAALTLVRPRGVEVRLDVESCRVHKGVALVKFSQTANADEAEELVGGTLVLPRGELKRPAEGRHYVADLIGVMVETTGGEPVGAVEEVSETGANDVFVVRVGEREVLIPVVDHVVKEIDLE